jgi:hypothetical protein
MEYWLWQHGTGGIEEFKMENAGYRLTASEEYYRTQWLTTVRIIKDSSFLTLQQFLFHVMSYSSGNVHWNS